jgi:hypothetical protein
MYTELSSLHAGISEDHELEQPSMRFTKNVMDAVQAVHVARPIKQYINRGIIRGIAALYILAIIAALGYAIATSTDDLGNGAIFSKLNLSGLFSSGFFTLVVCVNIVLGLVVVDLILRRKGLRHLN